MKSLSLKSKEILLGITGGIAAYKAVDILRRMKSMGASVTVLMTEAAARFISPVTFESLSGNTVYTDLFSSPLAHISLTSSADAYLIAPATANTIGRLASGLAGDIVSLSFLSFEGPVIIAPSMNWRMYGHPVLQRNLGLLREIGVQEVAPEEGELACGEYGKGRMASLERIMEAVGGALLERDLKGKKVLITAGPTREHIDPVRFISNRSSGRMGYALARVAKRRGAEVILISGPTMIPPPPGIEPLKVESADEMMGAVAREVRRGVDLLIMAAAVADFKPKAYSTKKMDKGAVRSLELTDVPDIIKEVSSMKKRPFIIGFSAETGSDTERAKRKQRAKGTDLIVFNDVTSEGAGFESETNRITIMAGDGVREYPLMSKEECAGVIFDYYLNLTGRQPSGRGR